MESKKKRQSNGDRRASLDAEIETRKRGVAAALQKKTRVVRKRQLLVGTEHVLHALPIGPQLGVVVVL